MSEKGGRKRARFDEANLAENEAWLTATGPRMKIDEPNTPYHHSSGGSEPPSSLVPLDLGAPFDAEASSNGGSSSGDGDSGDPGAGGCPGSDARAAGGHGSTKSARFGDPRDLGSVHHNSTDSGANGTGDGNGELGTAGNGSCGGGGGGSGLLYFSEDVRGGGRCDAAGEKGGNRTRRSVSQSSDHSAVSFRSDSQDDAVESVNQRMQQLHAAFENTGRNSDSNNQGESNGESSGGGGGGTGSDSDGDGAYGDGFKMRGEEEEEERQEAFRKARKAHYNEFEMVRRMREMQELDDDEEDEEDEEDEK